MQYLGAGKNPGAPFTNRASYGRQIGIWFARLRKFQEKLRQLAVK